MPTPEELFNTPPQTPATPDQAPDEREASTQGAAEHLRPQDEEFQRIQGARVAGFDKPTGRLSEEERIAYEASGAWRRPAGAQPELPAEQSLATQEELQQARDQERIKAVEKKIEQL